jgi:hypothetical protein
MWYWWARAYIQTRKASSKACRQNLALSREYNKHRCFCAVSTVLLATSDIHLALFSGSPARYFSRQFTTAESNLAGYSDPVRTWTVTVKTQSSSSGRLLAISWNLRIWIPIMVPSLSDRLKSLFGIRYDTRALMALGRPD